jgi:lipopolysaccharide export system permease protein
MGFERYGVLVARQSQAMIGETAANSLPTALLIANPTNFNRGELLWRLALPVMGLLLMLLAIPLSFVNPRGGRSANLLVALLLFIIYSNMTSVFQAAVVQQRLALSLAWWPLHLVAALLVVFLFSWRLNINSRHHPASLWSVLKRAVLFRKAGQQ